MKFNELQLNEKILRSLEKNGFNEPTEIQAKAIPIFLEGKNLFGKSGTGTGKTAAFVLPILEKINPKSRKPQAIILTPTRDLTNQIVDQIRKLSGNLEDISIAAIIGGMRISDQVRKIKQSQIVVGTPGRVKDHIDRNTFKLDSLEMIILDEADEMLKMGFKNEIDAVFNGVEKEVQVGLFSATNTPRVMDIAKNYMKDFVTVEINNAVSVNQNISNTMILTKGINKEDLILEVFKKHTPQRAIIFTNTKNNTDRIAKNLSRMNIDAAVINGDKKQSHRTRAIHMFKNREVNVIVATDVIARGIDIDDIDYVINYDISMEDEHFVHRIGRTGRNGKTGNSISFIQNQSTLTQMNRIKKTYQIEIDEIVHTEYNVTPSESRNDRDSSGSRSRGSRQGQGGGSRSRSNDSRGGQFGGSRSRSSDSRGGQFGSRSRSSDSRNGDFKPREARDGDFKPRSSDSRGGDFKPRSSDSRGGDFKPRSNDSRGGQFGSRTRSSDSRGGDFKPREARDGDFKPKSSGTKKTNFGSKI